MNIVIVHSIADLDINANIAVRYRPLKLANELSALGFDVRIITGTLKKRVKLFLDILTDAKNGSKILFLYHETNFRPMIIDNGRGGIGFNFFIDHAIFLLLARKKIKMGLFYRDALWRNSSSLHGRRFSLRNFYNILHLVDLYIYKKLFNVIYLPTFELLNFVPEFKSNQIDILPPGVNISHNRIRLKKWNRTLIYVGAVSGHYDISELFSALMFLKEWRLILCVRKEDFERLRRRDDMEIPPNVEVIHADNNELYRHYNSADVGLFFVEPNNYMKAAMPVKIFEYVSAGLPVLASEGTLAADLVLRENIGWVISYKAKSLIDFLKKNKSFDSKIDIMKSVESFHASNTWRARAEKIINDLGQF